MDWLLNLTPVRFGMLNAFVVARKPLKAGRG
jgi:hypothetical protein